MSCASTGCAACRRLRASHRRARHHTHAELKADPGYRALLTLPGVGKVIAAIFVAEIGDITRFASAKKLCSWAGLTPKDRDSDKVVHRGEITEQGSPLVRWTAIEAVGNYRATRSCEPDPGASPSAPANTRPGSPSLESS